MSKLVNRLKFFLAIGCIALNLNACSGAKSEANTKAIKVGTIAGPETQLMDVAKTVAMERYHLNIQIIPFTDYNQPNEALNNGSLYANVFQHLPYLDAAIKAQGYALVAVGKTFLYPMGIYSKRYQSLGEVTQGTIVAIPNDPSNQARALLLLASAKLIQLKGGGNAESTVLDISANPRQLHIQPIDAAQLPRVLPDVGLAVINTNYAVVAGLLPNRDALYTEGKDSPYANLIVVRQADANTKQTEELVDALHSKEVEQKAVDLFSGQAIPAW